MVLNELEEWRGLIRKEHRYYDTNQDKNTRLEAEEERDMILELYPKAKNILSFIVSAHMKWKEGEITKEESEYIKETRTFPPTKGPSMGGLEFWLCKNCGLIIHCTDICPFCGRGCNTSGNAHFGYKYRVDYYGERLTSWMKKEIEVVM